MSRNARTPTPRGRRIALSFGTAAGAALIAASISMGTAPAAGADVTDADPVSDLIGAFDPHAFSAAGVTDPAAGVADPAAVSETDAISYLIEAFDPNPFTTSGAPTDPLGLLGWYLDDYLFGPTAPFYEVDAFLDPYVLDLVKSLPAGAASAATVGGADPVSDLIGALDPSAFRTRSHSVIDGLVGSSHGSSDLGTLWLARPDRVHANQMAASGRKRSRPSVSALVSPRSGTRGIAGNWPRNPLRRFSAQSTDSRRGSSPQSG